MGQFVPGSESKGLRSRRDLAVYVAGAMLGSTLSCWVLYELRMGRANSGRLSIFVAATCVVLGVDTLRVAAGNFRPMGLSRQTPYAWRLRGWKGVLGWGLDTGTTISTVRASSLPLLASGLLVLGFGSSWFGVFYGIGVSGSVIQESISRRGREHGEVRVASLMRRGARLRSPLGVIGPTAVVLGMSLAALWYNGSRGLG